MHVTVPALLLISCIVLAGAALLLARSRQLRQALAAEREARRTEAREALAQGAPAESGLVSKVW